MCHYLDPRSKVKENLGVRGDDLYCVALVIINGSGSAFNLTQQTKKQTNKQTNDRMSMVTCLHKCIGLSLEL